MIALACSCGDTKRHVVMRRRTSDNKGVSLCNDGSISDWAGFYIVSPRRATWAIRRAIEVGRFFMGDVELYDFAELPALWNAAFYAAGYRACFDDEEVRRMMRGSFEYHAAKLRA